MDELLPCPFCGGPAEILHAAPDHVKREFKIICANVCDAMDEDWWRKEYLQQAIDAWNTRWTPPGNKAISQDDIDKCLILINA